VIPFPYWQEAIIPPPLDAQPHDTTVVPAGQGTTATAADTHIVEAKTYPNFTVPDTERFPFEENVLLLTPPPTSTMTEEDDISIATLPATGLLDPITI
jgi:hypothetical protein